MNVGVLPVSLARKDACRGRKICERESAFTRLRDACAPQKRKAQHFDQQSAGFWRRPTLARPVAVLPSGLQRFTAVFGMGTGGATALMSPELSPESFRGSVLVK